MDTWQPSTLSWSFSTKRHFDCCNRHYFYHRFWGQDPKLKWRLFEMRNLTTLLMLRGRVVHIVVADALKAIRNGETVDAAGMKAKVTEVIRELYAESARGLWRVGNRPPGRKASEITSLLEHYYKLPNTEERAREAQQVAWACVENLAGSDLWNRIAKSDPDTWRVIEEAGFPSFDLDGIRVYARIDFAHSDGEPTIIDWKTGAQTDEDRSQLVVYSLYAQSKWGWDPQQTRLAAVYLQPEFSVDSFAATSEDLNRVTELIKDSFSRMLELEPAYGPANIADFPMTDNLDECAWCRFRGICPGAKRREQTP